MRRFDARSERGHRRPLLAMQTSAAVHPLQRRRKAWLQVHLWLGLALLVVTGVLRWRHKRRARYKPDV